MTRRWSEDELARAEAEVGLTETQRSAAWWWNEPIQAPPAPLGERLKVLAGVLGIICFLVGMSALLIAPETHDGHIAYLNTPAVILMCVGFGPLALAALGFALYGLALFTRWVATGR